MRGVILALTAALALATGPLRAAHVFAAVPGAIRVYSAGFNGRLVLQQTVASGPVTAIATTPGGRFLYATDGLTITQYSLRPDGTIVKWGAPTTVPGHEATNDLVIHPTTGDYLYTIATTMCAFRTDDADGHLTLAAEVSVETDGFRLAANPLGEYMVALAGERGSAVTVKTNPDGTPMGRISSFALPGLATGAIAADSRFVYVGTVPFDEAGPPSLLVLSLQTDGSLVQLSSRELPANKLLAVRDRLLAVSAGGPGSKLELHAVSESGELLLTDSAPIEVYALGKGSGPWAPYLWVATNDGIVTYAVGANRKLARISKVIVDETSLLAFGAR